MNKSKVISILGCGWLGFPLGKKLVEAGFNVKGSTTKSEKLCLLTDAGIDSYVVRVHPNLVSEKAAYFFECDVLLINIPPKGNPENFLSQIQEIRRLAEGKAKKTIFISSTSVYGDENKALNEDDEPTPETESGKVMLEVERLLAGPNTTVIRFAGLVGPDRHPGRFLAGKQNIPQGDAPINLIHLDDCIGIISAVINQDAFGITLNACAPNHPTRKDFYTLAAEKGAFAIPEFIGEKRSWKIIDSKNLSKLNYDFKITNLMDWLNHL